MPVRNGTEKTLNKLMLKAFVASRPETTKKWQRKLVRRKIIQGGNLGLYKGLKSAGNCKFWGK